MHGNTHTIDGFINKATAIHYNKYDYSLSTYVNSQIKLKINLLKKMV